MDRSDSASIGLKIDFKKAEGKTMKTSDAVLRKRAFCTTRVLIFCFAIVILLLNGSPAFPQEGQQPDASAQGLVPGRYIVVLRHGIRNPTTVAGRMARAHRFTLGHVYQRALKGFAASLPQRLAQSLRSDPNVAFIEQDRRVYAVAQTLPSGINRMDVDTNPVARIDGVDERVDVDIAVLDTGVDLDHPDLNVYSSTNCARWGSCRDGAGDDVHGHGSHVAGIAAAIDNDIGVVGVAPGARIWAVRVLDSSGAGYLSWLLKGIDWVAAHADAIEVANMSLAWTGYSAAAREAIQNAVNSGVVFVVAAGNESVDIYGPDGVFGTGDDVSPAAFPEVAAVSALEDYDGMPGEPVVAGLFDLHRLQCGARDVGIRPCFR
jgi:subtilisin